MHTACVCVCVCVWEPEEVNLCLGKYVRGDLQYVKKMYEKFLLVAE